MSRPLRSVVVAGIAVAPVLVSVACYGPTEVWIELTTDVGCEGTTTAIYRDAHQEASTAVIPGCPGSGGALTGGEGNIGSVVFVPSGSRKGEASVKIVMGTDRVPPDRCGAEADKCIVATRSFSFVEHASLRVPIHLTKDCIGKSCADGTTCIGGGECVSDLLQCGAGECSLAGAGADAPGRVDASDPGEAGVDAALGPDVAFETCAPAGSRGLLATLKAMPRYSAALEGRVYFVDPGSPGKLRRVANDAVAGTTRDTETDAIAAFAARGENWYVAGAEENKLFTSLGDFDVAIFPAWIAPAPGGSSPIAVFDSGGKGVTVTPPPVDEPRTFTTLVRGPVAADGTAVYARQKDAISALTVDTGGEHAKELAFGSGGDQREVIFATNGMTGDVFAAGVALPADAATRPQIVRLKSDGYVPVAAPNETVTSFAVDDKDVYWTGGTAVHRSPRMDAGAVGSSPSVKLDLPASATVGPVAVDSRCFYVWLEWTTPVPIAPKKIELRALRKGLFARPDIPW